MSKRFKLYSWYQDEREQPLDNSYSYDTFEEAVTIARQLSKQSVIYGTIRILDTHKVDWVEYEKAIIDRPIRTIKQPPGSKSCGAAVAAMVTGKELDEVLFGKDEMALARTSDLARYLLDNGWMMGTGIVPSTRLTPDCEINATISLKDKLAILCVPSINFPGCSHWVLWDGYVGAVRDPNPLTGETRMLSSLKIEELWLLSDIRET